MILIYIFAFQITDSTIYNPYPTLYSTLLGVVCKLKEDTFYFPDGIWLYLPIEFLSKRQILWMFMVMYVLFFSEFLLVDRVCSPTLVVFKHLNYSYISGKGKHFNLRFNTTNFRVSEPKNSTAWLNHLKSGRHYFDYKYQSYLWERMFELEGIDINSFKFLCLFLDGFIILAFRTTCQSVVTHF